MGGGEDNTNGTNHTNFRRDLGNDNATDNSHGSLHDIKEDYSVKNVSLCKAILTEYAIHKDTSTKYMILYL